MSYQIEIRTAFYCIEVTNFNAGCGTKHTAAYIVKSDINGKFNYFITVGMTDAEILAKGDSVRFEQKGVYATYAEAQAKALSIVNSEVNRASVLEVWADAANAILHTAIAEQADLQNEANEAEATILELDLVPANACEDVTLEALQAGAAFDNIEPTPAFSLHYEMPTNIYDLDELSNVIAEEEWRALGTVDAEINALKAKLIQLNDKRIGIVEECAHWRGKCERAIEIAEYEQNYDDNEAQADLRQSIWFATGQDIM
jgi:hypothetical protein